MSSKSKLSASIFRHFAKPQNVIYNRKTTKQMINRGYELKVKSFNEIACFDYTKQLIDNIKKEIENKGKVYILGLDEEEYKAYLID